MDYKVTLRNGEIITIKDMSEGVISAMLKFNQRKATNPSDTLDRIVDIGVDFLNCNQEGRVFSREYCCEELGEAYLAWFAFQFADKMGTDSGDRFFDFSDEKMFLSFRISLPDDNIIHVLMPNEEIVDALDEIANMPDDENLSDIQSKVTEVCLMVLENNQGNKAVSLEGILFLEQLSFLKSYTEWIAAVSEVI